MLKNVLFVVLAIFMIACFEQGDCSDYSSNILHVSFYNYSTKGSKTILIDSVIVDGWDSVMYKAKNVSSVTIPLNNHNSSAKIHFYYSETHATVDVTYRINTFALAPDCNAVDIIELEEATPTIIQEVKISQASLSNNATENIKLYF